MGLSRCPSPATPVHKSAAMEGMKGDRFLVEAASASVETQGSKVKRCSDGFGASGHSQAMCIGTDSPRCVGSLELSHVGAALYHNVP